MDSKFIAHRDVAGVLDRPQNADAERRMQNANLLLRILQLETSISLDQTSSRGCGFRTLALYNAPSQKGPALALNSNMYPPTISPKHTFQWVRSTIHLLQIPKKTPRSSRFSTPPPCPPRPSARQGVARGPRPRRRTAAPAEPGSWACPRRRDGPRRGARSDGWGGRWCQGRIGPSKFCDASEAFAFWRWGGRRAPKPEKMGQEPFRIVTQVRFCLFCMQMGTLYRANVGQTIRTLQAVTSSASGLVGALRSRCSTASAGSRPLPERRRLRPRRPPGENSPRRAELGAAGEEWGSIHHPRRVRLRRADP